MSNKSEIILEVCAVVAQQADLKVTVKESAKGAAIVIYFGALLAGRRGLLTGAAMALGSEFISAADVIKNHMDAFKREQLVKVIEYLLRGIDLTNTETVVEALSAKSSLKSKVVNEISNFLQYKMQLSVCQYP